MRRYFLCQVVRYQPAGALRLAPIKRHTKKRATGPAIQAGRITAHFSKSRMLTIRTRNCVQPYCRSARAGAGSGRVAKGLWLRPSGPRRGIPDPKCGKSSRSSLPGQDQPGCLELNQRALRFAAGAFRPRPGSGAGHRWSTPGCKYPSVCCARVFPACMPSPPAHHRCAG